MWVGGCVLHVYAECGDCCERGCGGGGGGGFSIDLWGTDEGGGGGGGAEYEACKRLAKVERQRDTVCL